MIFVCVVCVEIPLQALHNYFFHISGGHQSRDHELVPACTREKVCFAKGLSEDVRGVDEQLITGVIAVGLIY